MVASLKRYLQYFISTYVGSMDPITCKRGDGRIPLELWNKYSHVMRGATDLTNNVAENYNSVSKVCKTLN